MKSADTMGLFDTSVFFYIWTQTNKKNNDDPINSATRVPNIDSYGVLHIVVLLLFIVGSCIEVEYGNSYQGSHKCPHKLRNYVE